MAKHKAGLCQDVSDRVLQKQAKYTDNKLKALKARNEYLLCLDAANAAVHKYFTDDLPDLIDVSSCGVSGLSCTVSLVCSSSPNSTLNYRFTELL